MFYWVEESKEYKKSEKKPHKSISHTVVFNSLHPLRMYPTRLLYPWDSPGKNTGMGCHFLLKGIFPTQELKLGLLHCRQILY